MKKFSTLLLIVFAMMMAVTSCVPAITTGNNGNGKPAITTPERKPTMAPSVPALNDEAARVNVCPGFENVDFEDYVFTFAAPIYATDGWKAYEVYADEDGEGIHDASIIRRNNLMYKHYKCFIEVEDIALGSLENDFITNQNRIDLLLTKYNLGGKKDDKYYDFHSLGMDLTKPWWDQNFINGLTVDGKLYGMLGSFSLTSLDATWLMYFNKDFQEHYEHLKDIDLYQLVYDNEWTLDKFNEIVKQSSLISTSFGVRNLYFGAGQSYINKTDDKDGTTTFTTAFDNDAIDVTNKIIDIYDDSRAHITDYNTLFNSTVNGTTLFSHEVLSVASFLAGKAGPSTKSVNFGILPFPKLNASQEGYRHHVDNHYIYMCVPKTCQDIVRLTTFLELYAYHSYYTVYRDYIDTYQDYCTDVDSLTMLQTVLDSRYFEFGYNYSIATFDNDYMGDVQYGKNLISEQGVKLGKDIVTKANELKNKLSNG